MNALVVMARYPRAGRVKTRIAARLGAAGAASLYRAFLEDLALRFGTDDRWSFHWAFTPAGSPFRRELARGLPAFAQPSGDLGERMAGSMAKGFAAGASRVVLIGSDLPHLDPSRVAEAFTRLAAGADLVLGPAEDGGYYLVGSSDVPPIFQGIAWGGRGVLRRTLARARLAGRRPELLAAHWDLDRESDLRRLWRDPALEALPSTRSRLRELFDRGRVAGDT